METKLYCLQNAKRSENSATHFLSLQNLLLLFLRRTEWDVATEVPRAGPLAAHTAVRLRLPRCGIRRLVVRQTTV